MVLVENFINILKKNKITFFTGVPDSILKSFCYYLDKYSKKKHVLATNEGSAISIGIGHYLSKKRSRAYICKILVLVMPLIH